MGGIGKPSRFFFVSGEYKMEHSVIPDNQRHEPKGASTAFAGQVLKSNGGGTTSFGSVSFSEITDVPDALPYERILVGTSTALNQNPSAVDTPLQVEFGPAQAFADVSIASNGTITFNTSGSYLITLFLRFGRTTGAGAAIVLNRVLVNGVQTLNTNAVTLPDANITVPFSATIPLDVTAGTTFQLQIARDSAGINNGGLLRTPITTLPWNISTTATVAVYKYRGLL